MLSGAGCAHQDEDEAHEYAVAGRMGEKAVAGGKEPEGGQVRPDGSEAIVGIAQQADGVQYTGRRPDQGEPETETQAQAQQNDCDDSGVKIPQVPCFDIGQENAPDTDQPQELEAVIADSVRIEGMKGRIPEKQKTGGYEIKRNGEPAKTVAEPEIDGFFRTGERFLKGWDVDRKDQKRADEFDKIDTVAASGPVRSGIAGTPHG